MAAAFDLKVDNNDVVIQNNDFVWTESDQQHIQDTINAFPGWWKENFADGVGILAYLNASGREQELARSIKIQLQSDGYTLVNPTVTMAGDTIKAHPNAVRN